MLLFTSFSLKVRVRLGSFLFGKRSIAAKFVNELKLELKTHFCMITKLDLTGVERVKLDSTRFVYRRNIKISISLRIKKLNM